MKGVKKDLELNTSACGILPVCQLFHLLVGFTAAFFETQQKHTFLKAFSVLVSLLCSVYRVTPETVSTSTYVTRRRGSLFSKMFSPGLSKQKGW